MNDLSDLAFFVQLVRCGSMAATAKALDVSPPAVSRRLAQVEKRLGVMLLNRTTRRLATTPEGERYFSEGIRILEDIAALEDELTADQAEPRGVLRVNASFGFGRRVLVRLVSDMRKQYRKLEVQLELTDRMPSLAEVNFDVAIRFGDPPDARLIAHKLVTNHRVVCAAPSYLASRPVISHPRDLAGQDCLLVRENRENPTVWHLFNRGTADSAKIKVGGPLSSNDGEAVVRWALDGHGIVLRSVWDISQELSRGTLLQVLPGWTSAPADIFLLVPQRMNTSAKVRAFVAFARHWLANESGLTL